MEYKNDITETNWLADTIASTGFSRAFYNVFYMLIPEVIKTASDHPTQLTYEVCIKDYVDRFRLSRNNDAYVLLCRESKQAFQESKSYEIAYPGNGTIQFVLFQSIVYIPNEGKIVYQFGEYFKRLLIESLQKRGLKIYLSTFDTLPMDSAYSKAFYPLLLKRVHKKNGDRMKFSAEGSLHGKEFDRIESIEAFRTALHVPASYRTSQVKNIVSLIQAEINQFTPYQVSAQYNTIRTVGRYPKITYICWLMEHKKDIPDSYYEDIESAADQTFFNAEPETKDSGETQFSLQDISLIMAVSKCTDLLSDKDIINIVRAAKAKKISSEEMVKVINYALTQKPDNLVGYINALIKNGMEEPKKKRSGRKKVPILDREDDYSDVEDDL